MGIVYLVKNILDGKCYIGQTNRTLHTRKLEHLSDARCHTNNSYFHNALCKYGDRVFKWSILAEAKEQEKLNKLERFYIEEYNSIKEGYNLKEGGSNGKHTKETCRKISSKLKGRIFTPEHCEKISKRMKGKNHPFYGKKRPEHSLKMKGKNNPNYGLKGPLNPNYGKKKPPMSKETRMKISKANKGRKASREEVKKNRETKAGKGLFGFTGGCYKEKEYKPWNRVWMCYIKYFRHTTYLGYFNDPLSCEIVYTLVKNEIERI